MLLHGIHSSLLYFPSILFKHGLSLSWIHLNSNKHQFQLAGWIMYVSSMQFNVDPFNKMSSEENICIFSLFWSLLVRWSQVQFISQSRQSHVLFLSMLVDFYRLHWRCILWKIFWNYIKLVKGAVYWWQQSNQPIALGFKFYNW
jgi:hypothetical protein